MTTPTGIQSGTERPMSAAKTALILLATIGGSIAGLAAFVWYATPATDTIVSGHGTVAMVMGIVFSLVVGIALMGLVFYSSRRGYDDEATSRRRGPPVAVPGEQR